MKFKCFSYGSVESTNSSAMYLIKKKNYNNGFILATSQKKEGVGMEKNGYQKRVIFSVQYFFKSKKIILL